MGLLNAAADFHIRLCGHEDSLFAYLGTEKQRHERYDRDVMEIFTEEAPFDRGAHLLHLRDVALIDGETIILPFASPNLGEPVECVDGNQYRIDYNNKNEGKYARGEFVSAVLLLRYRRDLGSVTVATGIEEESPTMTGLAFSEQSIGSLDKPAEEFVRRFINATVIAPAAIINLHESVEKFYSPYSGLAIGPDEEVTEKDETLLFTEFSGVGGYVSQRLIDHLGDIDEDTIISDEHMARITIPGAVVFRRDGGWNGMAYYGFAPL